MKTPPSCLRCKVYKGVVTVCGVYVMRVVNQRVSSHHTAHHNGLPCIPHPPTMFVLPDGTDLRIRRLEACLAPHIQQRGIPAGCWEKAQVSRGPSDNPITAAARCLLQEAIRAMQDAVQDAANTTRFCNAMLDERIAAQHASASAVLKWSPRVWLAYLHKTQQAWMDCVKGVLNNGLYFNFRV